MIIMGVDPGMARVGWAVVEDNHYRMVTIAYGCITTLKGQPDGNRLITIFRKVKGLFTHYKPQELALEDLFFATNAKTIIPVGQARGVIVLAAAQEKIPVISYTPLAVKRAITGDGNADKTQILHMVMKILSLRTVPKPDDTADALAIALTHTYSYKLKAKIK